VIVIHLVSINSGSGKTTIAAALGKHFLRQNKKTGYFKPIISSGKSADKADASLMRHLLSLEETEDTLSPVFTDEIDLKSSIMSSFIKVAKGKDFVIMEGISGTAQFASTLAGIFSAKVIGVETYSADYTGTAKYYQVFGKPLIGLIANKVPKRRLAKAAEELSKATGIKVLGTVPEERALMSLTVIELAQLLDGQIISGEKETNTIIENFMLGAMVPDHPVEYFGRKTKKAAILKRERSDMQMSALETPTVCLILAGKTPPITRVIQKAEEKHVPIIVVNNNIVGITATLEKAFGNTRLSFAKAGPAAEIVTNSIKLAELETMLMATD
jgi:uncharacterized protein